MPKMSPNGGGFESPSWKITFFPIKYTRNVKSMQNAVKSFWIDFTFLVYFMGKIVICPDGDSNPRPFGLIFGIKTPNRILAFLAIRTLER
jgi:hypothetical protein